MLAECFKHELGHAVAGLQAGALKATIIVEGATMRCDFDWPPGATELAVAISWAGGPLVEPSAMSGEDHLIMRCMPKPLREQAEAFVERNTVPVVDGLDPAIVAKMLADLVVDGHVSIEIDNEPMIQKLLA